MLITIGQVKAARALLGWSQKDLAQHADLTQDHVANFESQRSRSLDVLESINNVLTAQGIVFTAYGVELHHETITYLDGENCYLDLLDDVAASSVNDIYLIGADDARSSKEVDNRVTKMNKQGKTFHYLISEDVQIFKQSPELYRKVPGKWLKDRDVTLIYGDIYAFYLPTGGGRVMRVKNAYLANDYRKLFEMLWSLGHEI